MLGVVKRALKSHLPPPLLDVAKTGRQCLKRHVPWPVVRAAKQVIFSGSARQCPICESSVRSFLDTFYVKADRCPVCRGVNRTRLTWLYLSRHTDLLTKPQSVLHVAPEPAIAARLAGYDHLNYVAGDLEPWRYAIPKRIVRVDLTDAPFPENSFDTIICNHVLEHIPNDQAAMREIFRILKPSGLAMLLVPDPHKLAVTIEAPDAPPEERAKRFGQANHMRLYGADYADRLRAIGFLVTRWLACENEPVLCATWMLDPTEEVYIGQKAI